MPKTDVIPKSKAKTAYGLLTEVRKLILAEPLRYDQRDWLSRKEEFPGIKTYPKCGTVACVAGWVATLKGPKDFEWSSAGTIAQKILGLSDAQEYRLFAEDAAGGASQTMRHAEQGANHIAAFQKANRAQLMAKKV